jgi:hypothetical protein
MMNHELLVLRAVLRLARRRAEANVDAIEVRVGSGAPRVRVSLRRLERAGLLYRSGDTAKLTLEGLALAVALLPVRAFASPVRARHAA